MDLLRGFGGMGPVGQQRQRDERAREWEEKKIGLQETAKEKAWKKHFDAIEEAKVNREVKERDRKRKAMAEALRLVDKTKPSTTIGSEPLMGDYGPLAASMTQIPTAETRSPELSPQDAFAQISGNLDVPTARLPFFEKRLMPKQEKLVKPDLFERKIKRLQKRRDAGKMTQQEYEDAEMKLIMGGGQTINVTYPQELEAPKPMSAESAGKAASVQLARQDIADVKNFLFPKGVFSRKNLLLMNAVGGGVPWTGGRDAASMITNALETKLRQETGATARPEEVESMAERFRPSFLDTGRTARQKLRRLGIFMQYAEIYQDPTGAWQVDWRKLFKKPGWGKDIKPRKAKKDVGGMKKKYPGVDEAWIREPNSGRGE